MQYIQSVANSFFWFAVVLGVLVFVHEFGHFFMAKLFRMRVEVFSLGFGPRLAGWRRGETEYRVSAVPLGGYVKLTGEMGQTEVASDQQLADSDGPKPAEDVDADRQFASRPRWQRFLVLVMGATVRRSRTAWALAPSCSRPTSACS